MTVLDAISRPCPYCTAGCGECSATAQRHSTLIDAGDGITAVVHGDVAVDDRNADAIAAVMRAAADHLRAISA